jgi:hypothetical protein
MLTLALRCDEKRILFAPFYTKSHQSKVLCPKLPNIGKALKKE